MADQSLSTLVPEDKSTEVEYRDVRGVPGYRVGSDGSVWSCWKRRTRGKGGGRGTESYVSDEWVRMSPETSDGYMLVALTTSNGKKVYQVHRLVLEAFVGPRPDGMEACHDPDPCRSNNAVSNLRWDTRRNNTADTHKHGTALIGSRANGARLTESQVRDIISAIASGRSNRDLSIEYSVDESTISLIKLGKSWRHVTGGSRVGRQFRRANTSFTVEEA